MNYNPLFDLITIFVMCASIYMLEKKVNNKTGATTASRNAVHQHQQKRRILMGIEK